MSTAAVSPDAPDPDDLRRAMAEASGMEFLPVLPAPSPRALALLPRAVAVRFAVAPVAVEPDEADPDPVLRVATADPLSFDLIDGVRFSLRREVRFVVAPPAEVERIIAGFYSPDA